MRVEVIINTPMSLKGQRILQAMADAAPIKCAVRRAPHFDSDILMTYGIGHPERRQWWAKQLRRGAHGIAWDLGYWDRDAGMMRCTIDHDHPQALIRPEAPERWDRRGVKLRRDADPGGPAVIIGLGRKALTAHGFNALQWERKAWKSVPPNVPVLYRPKRPTDPRLPGVRAAPTGPIEFVLKGASHVIARHSNVCVDAIIAGVPHFCDDGAAKALPPYATPTERLEFLRSLAHWQYSTQEAPQAWNFLLKKLDSISAPAISDTTVG